MAKFRGAGSQEHDRRRPTTSVRRRDRCGVEESIGDDVHIDNDNEQGLQNDDQVDQGEGFPGGPSDMSLLVNFADHVVVKLWEGELGDASYFNTKQLASYATLVQAWIYEHFLGMERRDINPSYDEVHPRATRYIVAHQICTVGDVWVQLDGVTHDDIIWTPYEDHRLRRPFETIYLFSGHLRLGSLSQRHMPERVLHQFGYEQNIPPSPMAAEAPGAHVIDQRWLQFDHHVVTGLRVASSPSTCVPEYMSWCRAVSHPYIRRGELGDRPSVVPRHRLRSPNVEQGIFRRIVNILQRMIDCRQVTEGTGAYESTEATLQLARSVTNDGAVYTRRSRNVRGHR
ncbi:uncharacterized protein [Phaseolus vulgaris]|uniref:uncharacterized protein n=1 Tax=Phaseolus vulgaris TaxID=3885 RepID=UPI0035CC410B